MLLNQFCDTLPCIMTRLIRDEWGFPFETLEWRDLLESREASKKVHKNSAEGNSSRDAQLFRTLFC